MTEDDLIGKLHAIVADAAPSALLVGIGDDAAVWQPSRSRRSVITTDALVEGVHFTRSAMSASDIGHRALASNLSDVAAMGAKPVLATIAFGVSGDVDEAWMLACYGGVAALAKRAKCAIAGGDIVRTPVVTISITVIGEVRASNLKLRSGMQPGDIIAVTGPLGASRAGLAVALERPELAEDAVAEDVLRAFRTPEPRLAEGKWLGASRHVRAMMDTSDGLSTDLARLARASNTGATIESLPTTDSTRAIAERAHASADAWALDGGEDFELLVAIDARAFSHLAARFHARFAKPLIRIGIATSETGIRRTDGSPVKNAGWDHLR